MSGISAKLQPVLRSSLLRRMDNPAGNALAVHFQDLVKNPLLIRVFFDDKAKLNE